MQKENAKNAEYAKKYVKLFAIGRKVLSPYFAYSAYV
jgi:hypothetical protein